MDAIIERFIEIWSTPERGRRLWEAWQAALGEHAGIIDKLAESEAEDSNIPLEEAQARLAIEKFIQDRGHDYAAKIVHQHDVEQLRASHTLQPMAVSSASKKKRK